MALQRCSAVTADASPIRTMPIISSSSDHRVRAERRWIGIAVLATAVAALMLRANAMAAELALAPYTDGPIQPALLWEAISAAIAVPVYAALAVLLARHPPLPRRRGRAAAAFVTAILGALAVLNVIDYLIMRAAGVAPGQSLNWLFQGLANFALGVSMAVAMVAAVTWSVRFEQLRLRRERRRVESERRYARAAFADVCRNVQPRFIAQCLDALEDAMRDPVYAERVLQRIARHIRLLRQQGSERVTLGSEIQVLQSIARLSPISFEVDIPEPVLATSVAKGFSAAVAELAAAGGGRALPMTVRLASASAEELRIAVTVPPEAVDQLDDLLVRLREDERLVRGATLLRDGTALVIAYAIVPAREDRPPRRVASAPPVPPLARFLPYLVVLFASSRWMLFTEADATIQAARMAVAGQWLVVAPLFWGLLQRFGTLSLPRIAGAAALSMLLTAGTSVAAVEIVSLVRDAPAVLAAARPNWMTVPRDAATIATVVATAALFLVQLRRAAEERLRAIRLHTLIARADISALESSFHPHFLFNSLNGILALLREDPSAARAMAGRLAALVRQMLHGAGIQEWSVRDERALAEKYLWVMSARFGEGLRVDWQIGRGVDEAALPRLLLQPLIENAIKHGIARRPDRGRISIVLRRTAVDRLLVAVENDTAAPVALPPAHGGGLGYTSARVVLLYGEASRPRYFGTDRSFRVEMALPLRR